MAMIHKYGLVIDVEALGVGLYKLIEERGQEGIVGFGTLPAEIMEMLERLIREKVLAIAAEQVGLNPKEAVSIIDEKKMREIVNDISHQVSVEIFRAASKAGKMIV